MARKHGGSAVLEGDAQGELQIDIPDAALGYQIQYIPWELIFADPNQPRVDADAELKASIAAGGIRQPIMVRPIPNEIGTYQIIDGERRWRGAEGVQKQIPCIVRADLDERAIRLRDQLVANTGKPLTPVEEARAIAELHTARGGSIAELAAHLGKPISTVSQRLNLMQLGPWLDLIQRGLIKYTHAAEVLLRYRGCPDTVHVAVIDAVSKLFAHGNVPSDGWFASAEEFARVVEEKFKSHLYPITKSKEDSAPRFDTAPHDRECSCGGIDRTDWRGKRRYCGNPEWWQPRDKAAKKLERAKVKKSKPGTSGATKPSGPPAEPSWQREQRLQKERGQRVIKARGPLLTAFAAVIKKLPAKAGGALESAFLESVSLRVSSKSESAKLLARGSSMEDLVRRLVLEDVEDRIKDEWQADRSVRALGKELGVDVQPIIDKAAPIEKPKVEAPGGPVEEDRRQGGRNEAVKHAKKRRANAAFMKPVTPNEKLAVVVGAGPMPKTELITKLWAYIKKHGLQDKKNRRMINADVALKAVFGGKAKVSMFDMTKLITNNLK